MIGINAVGKKGERLANQMFQYAAVKGIAKNRGYSYCAVSYTHLTLPTNREV